MNSYARLASSARLAMTLGLGLAASAALVACYNVEDPAHATDSTDAGTGDDSTGSTIAGPRLTYSPMYSAFVEGHEAQLPVKFRDANYRGKGAKFSSSDPTIAAVANTADGATITVKRDGVVVITAALDGETTRAKLVTTKFTAAQWAVGEARYAKSELAIVPADGEPLNVITFARDPRARNMSGACTTCHGEKANVLQMEATPTQTAGYSDQELITIFTMGKKPEGWVQKSQIPAFVWNMFHAWTVTEEEKQGLIAFLRTQVPKEMRPEIHISTLPCGVDAADRPVLCDPEGRPVPVPGRGGALDAATPPMTGDAGLVGTPDTGAPGDAADVDGATSGSAPRDRPPGS